MNTSTSTKSAVWEDRLQILIMLAIGIAGAIASFKHVHDVAYDHGQPDWLAWADAICLELMSIAAGLEMRRRKRLGLRVRAPFIVLVVAVLLSLSAQILEAEQSPIGWIAAAIPSLGFLVMAKMALSRGGHAVEVDEDEEPTPAVVKTKWVVTQAEKDARKRAGYAKMSATDKRNWSKQYRERVSKRVPTSPAPAPGPQADALTPDLMTVAKVAA